VEEKVDRVGLSLAETFRTFSDSTLCQAFLDLTDKQNREFRYVL